MDSSPDDPSRAGGDSRDRRPDRHDAQRNAYVADVSARLRHVCRHLTDDEFSRLVADMAETKRRFAAIDAAFWPMPEPGDLADRGGSGG